MLKTIATSAAARFVFRKLLRQPPLVLTYHRFAGESNGGRGMPAACLRRQLDLLTGEGFSVRSLSDLMEAVEGGHDLPSRTVVLTVDDGYEDFADNGAPVFLEYGVPVTVFLTTGFVDGKVWMWWDQLDAAANPARPRSSVDVEGQSFPLAWHNEAERRRAAHRLAHHIERFPTVERERVLRSIFGQLEWTPPAETPGQFRPMSWDQVRRLEAAGIRFGAHTVTHPILALSDASRARFEIQHSHERCTAELQFPVPILAYPNGMDFTRGPREAEFAREAGLRGAVTMHPRFVTPRAFGRDPFSIPRIAAPEDMPSFIQLVAGPEALRQRARGWS